MLTKSAKIIGFAIIDYGKGLKEIFIRELEGFVMAFLLDIKVSSILWGGFMIPFGTKELHHQKKVCEMTMEDHEGNLACIGKHS
jgi:hypothetical protein